MDYEAFLLIAKTARELRTEAATYTLLEAYASSGCATYPVDSALFLELWPDGQVPGYVLTPYPHIHPPTHTVAYDMADDADARLIAAAPDLLAALKALLACADGLDGSPTEAHWNAASTAIYKAEGGAA